MQPSSDFPCCPRALFLEKKKMMSHGRNEAGLGALSQFRRPDGLPSPTEAPPNLHQLEAPPRVEQTCFALGVYHHAAAGPPRRPFCVPPPQSPSRSTGSARDYEDQLHLAASSTVLLERLQRGSKEGLTSVLVTLALCVFIGLIVSAVLATSRRLVAGNDSDPGATAAAAGLMLQAPAIAPPVVTGSQKKRGANSGTDGTATDARERAVGADADAARRRNASAQVAWLDKLEEREWTVDLNSSLTEESEIPATVGHNGSTAGSVERQLPRLPTASARA
ncbi:uncharacterized protein LOC125943576 [Dermacentor silvarum]|uniref:uncharacterized protein LOC125943576 n=1 Tax=Dermacentor silvarum TaxID=543639 RepID=UPI0021015BFE|nr:uncharacterized protein LOC125943576 [Dermacentor silvarum]